LTGLGLLGASLRLLRLLGLGLLLASLGLLRLGLA